MGNTPQRKGNLRNLRNLRPTLPSHVWPQITQITQIPSRLLIMALFSSPKPVIAMVHVGALPGTPAGRAGMRELEAQAAAEAATYREAGVHGVMLENMHDVPYLRGRVGPEITAAMTVLALAVKAASGGLPCGIQILAGANHEALAVAHAAGLEFVRVEGFAFAHVADEGLIESSAASLLRFRRAIGAERVRVWADVKKKHASHAITADVGIGETAAAAEFMRADAVIVTGTATGECPSEEDVAEVRARCRLPLYLGSGVTPENLGRYYALADGFIVGSAFKAGGRWNEAVDARRVARFMVAHAECAGRQASAQPSADPPTP
jgi:membrane complex biogenesis BtpA family protein